MSVNQRDPLRIVLVLSDSPFFQPRFVDSFAAFSSGDAVINGIVLSPLLARRMPLLRFLRVLWATLGYTDFFKLSAWYIRGQLARQLDLLWSGAKPASIESAARRHGIAVHRVEDVNSPESTAWISARQPDVLISGCFQLFGKTLLAQPRLGAINRHCSLLPAYRGLFPSFWAWLNNEPESGVSAHLMNDKLDSGAVLSQVKVPRNDGESLFHYVARCYEYSVELLWDATWKLHRGDETGAGAQKQGQYFSFPAKQDIARFRDSGYRLL